MTTLLIIAHAPLASALKAVAGHVYPEAAASLLVLDVEAHAEPVAVEMRARELLAQTHSSETLILTDVFGATPCNVARRLADRPQVRVVAGVNVPMLWRALCYAAEPLDTLAARALAGASQGILSVTPSAPQTQANQPPSDDQDHHHHHQ